ncbi:hypothetical protein ACFODL_06910 [Phenylobacterium terrae]|uniref:Uncharacterized protein n=1 Tax=Phenylobacterium terrae TaxID=2665495 RepID=A0ABW4N6A0_9CAUL
MAQTLTMAAFQFQTQGFDIGYGEEGLFAFGQTDDHSWSDSGFGDYTPTLHDQVISWHIDMDTTAQWDQYSYALRPEELTPRKELLLDFWRTTSAPVGRLLRSRFEPTRLSLNYSLPRDPCLAAFLLSALTSGRQLDVFCPGFHFIDEDRLAPAPSLIGFNERFEPAFVEETPILRLK